MFSDIETFIKHFQEVYPDVALRESNVTQYEHGEHVGRIELLEEMMEAVEANKGETPDGY